MKKIVTSLTIMGTLLSAPIVSNAALGDQTLRSGMNHSDVKELQQVLKQKGYFKQNTTTYFGSVTKQALINFQKANSLAADGIAGTATFKVLNKTNSTNKLLKQGMQGPEVQQVQQLLKQKGYFKQNTTTYFGSITRQAVISFQKNNGLVADGVVGSSTWGKLVSTSSAPKPSSPSSSNLSTTSKLINVGKKYIGVKYVWGGNTPRGFDCSGFLKYVFKEALGMELPRTVEGMYKVGKSVSSPSVGDLVFFETYKPGPSHAGIYLGNGQFLQAGTSTGVTISSMNNSYWASKYIGAKKMTTN